MKKKGLIVLLCSVSLVLGACGQGSSDKYAASTMNEDSVMDAAGAMDYDAGYSEETADMVEEDAKEEGESSNSEKDSDYSQKLIRTYDYSFETVDFDKSINYINEQVAKNQGYIEESSTYGKSNRSAYMKIRIPEKKAEVFKRLGALLDYAKEKNLVLLHENEKDIYGEKAKECLEIMEAFYCDNFKAVFDPANFVQSGQDTKEAYDMLKPYVAYMHIKDALLNGDVVPAGIGEGNIEYILDDLFKNGYDGYISLEPHLGSFEGLADLEIDDKMTKLEKGGEYTFTIAYKALEKIIDKII